LRCRRTSGRCCDAPSCLRLENPPALPNPPACRQGRDDRFKRGKGRTGGPVSGLAGCGWWAGLDGGACTRREDDKNGRRPWPCPAFFSGAGAKRPGRTSLTVQAGGDEDAPESVLLVNPCPGGNGDGRPALVDDEGAEEGTAPRKGDGQPRPTPGGHYRDALPQRGVYIHPFRGGECGGVHRPRTPKPGLALVRAAGFKIRSLLASGGPRLPGRSSGASRTQPIQFPTSSFPVLTPWKIIPTRGGREPG